MNTTTEVPPGTYTVNGTVIIVTEDGTVIEGATS